MGELSSRSWEVCVAGGGPAGIVVGYLLARCGLSVCVLEKHADFLRDFRGDTVHPSTLLLLQRLGLVERFLSLPHTKVNKLEVQWNHKRFRVADFSLLPVSSPYIAFVPQRDFLRFFTEEAARFAGFRLFMESRVDQLLFRENQVVGVSASTPGGKENIRAALVLGADGRHSTVRKAARLPLQDLGAPVDVLWMRLPKEPQDPSGQLLGYVRAGGVFAAIDRGSYYQCGLVIQKGEAAKVKALGLPQLEQRIGRLCPWLGERVHSLSGMEEVKLLEIRVDRLPRWHRPGLLCLGDAAHAMSPVGGVGINLAIADAVCAAGLLARPLLERRLTEGFLKQVQKRREPAVRLTQGVQLYLHRRIFSRAVEAKSDVAPPLFLRAFDRLRFLQVLPAWIFGLGLYTEHPPKFLPASPCGARSCVSLRSPTEGRGKGLQGS